MLISFFTILLYASISACTSIPYLDPYFADTLNHPFRESVEKIFTLYVNDYEWPESYCKLQESLQFDERAILSLLAFMNSNSGDEHFLGGYLELALRNTALKREYPHVFFGHNLVEKRILLRVMLYRTPLDRDVRSIIPINSFDTYLHLGAAELEVELYKQHNPTPALDFLLTDIRRFITFSSFMMKQIVWEDVNEYRLDFDQQPFEVIYLMRNGPKSDGIRYFDVCAVYASALWKGFLEAADNLERKEAVNAIVAPLGPMENQLDSALFERIRRFSLVFSKLSPRASVLFLEYCNLISKMIPFRSHSMRPIIEGALKTFWKIIIELDGR